MLESLATNLMQRANDHLLRQRPIVDAQSVKLINFASNDYLGLSTHPKIKQAMAQAIQHYGLGSGGSQVVCGYTTAHRELEAAIAQFTHRERALIFSTGYLANLGVITALCQEKDTIFIDKNVHASIIDAIKLSGANLKRFLHNDVASLDKNLKKMNAKNCLIITEGVFSMEGDIAPLPQILAIAKEHNAYIMVDDSHGIGVLGESGQGTLSHFNLGQDKVAILIASFGKACGSFGAFVAGSNELIENIIQFSRSFLCSTAMPPALAVANKTALEIIQQEGLTQRLQELITYFVTNVKQIQLPLLESKTPIQPLLLGDAKEAQRCHQRLLSRGFLVGMMRPPTVAPNGCRLRISITLNHTKQHIDQLMDVLQTL